MSKATKGCTLHSENGNSMAPATQIGRTNRGYMVCVCCDSHVSDGSEIILP